MDRYTLYGTQDFELEIAGLISLVSARFAETVDTKLVKALVLGGGYGRGEGGVLLQKGKESLYNDLDFFVFTRKTDIFQQRALQRQLHRLHKELSGTIGLDVDFSHPKAVSDLSTESVSLMAFDLLCGHKVVWGKIDLQRYYPRWQSEQLPADEAMKLLLNRAMGLYFASTQLESATPDTDFIHRNIQKAWQAMGEAILILERRYTSLSQNKIERLSSSPWRDYIELPEFFQKFRAAMEFKFRPCRTVESLAQLQEDLSLVVSSFRTLYYAAWSKLSQMPVQDFNQYKKAVRKQYPRLNLGRELLKNLLLNVRDMSIRTADPILNTSYPRHRLFLALPWLLFGENTDQHLLCDILGLPAPQTEKTLRIRFVQLWQRYN